MSGVAVGRPAPVREASIGVVVIRADGTVEPRGLVSYYHQNILLRSCVGLWIRWRAWRWSCE